MERYVRDEIDDMGQDGQATLDDEARRVQAEAATDVLMQVMQDEGVLLRLRVRAAIAVLAATRRGGGAPLDGRRDEPSLEGWLSRVGPRETGTPEEFEERARRVGL